MEHLLTSKLLGEKSLDALVAAQLSTTMYNATVHTTQDFRMRQLYENVKNVSLNMDANPHL